jgi:hypothetical protein
MGYLDNTSVTVDAILTNKGRELLAKGDGSFNITQFALADDEIDYDLWNPNHSLGSDFYGIVIENMPLTEAIPDETQAMKSRLLTLDNNTTTRIPTVQVDKASLTLNTGQSAIIQASTFGLNNANSTFGYSAILSDSSVAIINPAPNNEITSNILPTVPSISANAEATSIASLSQGAFRIVGKQLSKDKTATITIIGNETGGSTTVSVTVKAANLATTQRG